MKVVIYKYQGAGNDFVIVDNRQGEINLTTEQIAFLCNRRYGVGADGFIYLSSSEGYDFQMRYFNADGKEGTFCGNGARCLIAFAAKMGIKNFRFLAADGVHNGKVLNYSPFASTIELEMSDVTTITKHSPKSIFLNTGSPHLVIFVDNLEKYDVDREGKLWRHHPSFIGGTNVNFVQGNWGKHSSRWSRSLEEGSSLEFSVRTYERGVEAETLSCGTGAVASAIAYHKLLSANPPFNFKKGAPPYPRVVAKVNSSGGKLKVCFNHDGHEHYSQVTLIGEATFVFKSEIELKL